MPASNELLSLVVECCLQEDFTEKSTKVSAAQGPCTSQLFEIVISKPGLVHPGIHVIAFNPCDFKSQAVPAEGW